MELHGEKDWPCVANKTIGDVGDASNHNRIVSTLMQGSTTSDSASKSSMRKHSVFDSLFGQSKALSSTSLARIYSAAWGDDPNNLRCNAGRQRKPWRTAIIRFGPLSGIFCMCESKVLCKLRDFDQESSRIDVVDRS